MIHPQKKTQKKFAMYCTDNGTYECKVANKKKRRHIKYVDTEKNDKKKNK